MVPRGRGSFLKKMIFGREVTTIFFKLIFRQKLTFGRFFMFFWGRGSFLEKMIFPKFLGWGTKFGHLLYHSNFGQKCIFLIFWPPEGSWGGPGGREPPRKSIRCPPYFTNPWASLKRHTATYVISRMYIWGILRECDGYRGYILYRVCLEAFGMILSWCEDDFGISLA